jgi:hypothetical protein
MIALFFGGCMAMIAAASPTGVLGSAMHDGDVELVVSEVSTAANWRGDPRPKGEWIIATITVRNLDDERQEFAASNQKLID